MQDGPEGEAPKRPRGGTAARQGARPPGGAKRPGAKKLRVQLHLGEPLIQRLGVHCALVGRNQSAMVEEIVSAWLSRYGKGRELFGQADLPSQEGSADGAG